MVISLIGLIEGSRLTFFKAPHIQYDILGPGPYVLIISIGIMILGILHLIINFRKLITLDKAITSKEMRARMMSMVVVCGIYIFLIGTVGYLVSTILFFFLEFRILGIKFWLTNAVLTLCLTATYYFVFIRFCSMVFPRGILI
jgi:hypothetical protein